MRSQVKDEAFVTLLTSESYLPGALVLAASLRATCTRRQLLCLVSENTLSQGVLDALDEAFDRVIPVPLIRSSSHQNLALLGRPELDVTFTKLHAFDPDVVGVSNVAFLDADVMVNKNIDHIFKFIEGDVEFAAAPDIGWPDIFNTGVMVLKTKTKTFQELVHMATTHGSFDGGDQGLLNQFFPTWATGIPIPGQPFRRTGRLPFTFNVTPSSFYSYLPAFMHFKNDISAIHFIGQDKPWMTSRDDSSSSTGGELMQQYRQRWWQFHESIKHLIENASKQSTKTTQRTPTTTSASNSISNSGRSQAQSETIDDFANYRIHWNPAEARPITPIHSCYSVGNSTTTFTKTAPTKTVQRDVKPIDVGVKESLTAISKGRRPSYQEFEQKMSQAPGAADKRDHGSDLGNYRVGWNPAELKVPPQLKHLSPIAGEMPALAAPSSGSDDDEMDDRVWDHHQQDPEEWVARLKTERPRSRSAGSAKSDKGVSTAALDTPVARSARATK
ncbi:nucleotide-diphospho-sugar transferase [Gaertneriomyces semiglobifer]|nr:nucleotide-diphospho-sugar transferase [Gaertneriomyces semiglobifer]